MDDFRIPRITSIFNIVGHSSTENRSITNITTTDIVVITNILISYTTSYTNNTIVFDPRVPTRIATTVVVMVSLMKEQVLRIALRCG